MSDRGPLSRLGGPFANMSRETQIGVVFVGLAAGVGLGCAVLLLLVVLFTGGAPEPIAGDITTTLDFATADAATQGVVLTNTPGLQPTATEDTGFGLFTPIVQPTQGAFVTQIVVGNTGTPFYIPPPTVPATPTSIPFVPTNTLIPSFPSPTPQLIITDWLGEYFANPTLSGAPALMRNDVNIAFNWGTGAPAPGLPADYFSVRWTRILNLQEGTYAIDVVVDDAARVYIDNQLVLNAMREGPAQLFSQTVALRGGAHVFRVEFIEYTGLASIDLRISKIDVQSSEWVGQYFNNMTLSGQPVLTRIDPVLNFDWGVGSPAPGVPADRFSVRWTRTLYLPAATYRFYALSDDGVRMWVNGQLIIDQWHDAQGATYSADMTLAGGNHTIRVEYYENVGGARIAVWWDNITVYPDWRAEYFSNPDLAGVPVFIRNEPAINWDWGYGSPGLGVPSDNFSVRWTRQMNFAPGIYRFTAAADDGVRVYVDGRAIINQWRLATGAVYQADVALSGLHNLRVEFFEGPGIARIYVNWTRVGDLPTATPGPTSTPTLTPPPTSTPTPTATVTIIPTFTDTPTWTVTATEDPIFATQTQQVIDATHTQEAIYAQQTAAAIGEAAATATAQVVQATQTAEAIFATQTAEADAVAATGTAEVVYATMTAEAAFTTQTAEAIITQTLEAGAVAATQTMEAIYAQQTAEADAFAAATQTAEAEFYATQTQEAIFALQTAQADAFAAATQTQEAIYALQTAEADATQTAEAIYALQTLEAIVYATQTAEALYAQQTAEAEFYATQTAEAMYAQQTAEAGAFAATQTMEAIYALQTAEAEFYATQTAEAIYAQQTAEAGALAATQTMEAIFALQTAEAEFYATQTAEAMYAQQTAEAIYAFQTAEAGAFAATQTMEAIFALQTAEADAVGATMTAEALLATQVAEEIAATQAAEAAFATQTAEAVAPTEPPVEGVDAFDADYFPFRGIDWASQVYMLEGVVSNLWLSNDAPFIAFTLSLPDGSVVNVIGGPERVDMPIVSQPGPTPMPTPSLTPTAPGPVEPHAITEGQISPVVEIWQPESWGLAQRLNNGDTAGVLGVFENGQLVASAIGKRLPDGSGFAVFYRSLLHEDELRPELAAIYADLTVWVVTRVGNLPALTQGFVDLSGVYADPQTPVVARGTLIWDGLESYWLEDVIVYEWQAPRAYRQVWP